MGFRLPNTEFNNLVQQLKTEYKIYAPIRLVNQGRYADTDMIRYGEINTVEEIVTKEKSHYSAKEIVFPITQTLLYFAEEEYSEPAIYDQKIIIFLRPCDINAIRRLDTIFLENGPYQDTFYKQLRDKVKFFMIECKESYENCFCVSMNSNYTDNYSIAFRFAEVIYCDVKDETFEELFRGIGTEIDYTPEYVQENGVQVEVPEVAKMPSSIFYHDLWKDYSQRCSACGRCNVVCSTCSCFTMQDIIYEENPKAGERRRVWAGCHIDKFTDMAGGHSFRQDYGSRMRYKTMHKIYDYKKKFKEDMCVGCGRCDDQCPEYISFASCINKVSQFLKEEGKHAECNAEL